MFTIFESSDAKKKEAILNKRLMLLRCAYLKRYFKEKCELTFPKEQSLPDVLGVVADGVGSEPSIRQWQLRGPDEVVWSRLKDKIEKIDRQEQQLRLEGYTVGRCIKCNDEILIDVHTGENWCQKCNPPTTILGRTIMPFIELYEKIEKQKLKAEAEAIELVCPSCAGFGQRLDQDGKIIGICPHCKGSCVDPNRASKCPHPKPVFWGTGNKIVCLDCGEIIRRE